MSTVTIDRRFCGPPNSGNGGYVSGLLAKKIDGPATVRLRLPPPLETSLEILQQGERFHLMASDKLVAEGWAEPPEASIPILPGYDEAVEASKNYIGFTEHNFPGCFVCGPDRGERDGLRIFPGPVKGRDIVAGPWIPDGSLASTDDIVDPEFLWSALDCTSCFPMLPVPEGRGLVLGQLSVQIDGEVRVGEQCILIGWPGAVEGRKRFAGSAVIDGDGAVVAVANATWIDIDPKDFGG